MIQTKSRGWLNPTPKVTMISPLFFFFLPKQVSCIASDQLRGQNIFLGSGQCIDQHLLTTNESLGTFLTCMYQQTLEFRCFNFWPNTTLTCTDNLQTYQLLSLYTRKLQEDLSFLFLRSQELKYIYRSMCSQRTWPVIQSY